MLVRSDFLIGPIQNIIHVRAWAEAFGVNTLVHMSVLTGRGCHRQASPGHTKVLGETFCLNRPCRRVVVAIGRPPRTTQYRCSFCFGESHCQACCTVTADVFSNVTGPRSGIGKRAFARLDMTRSDPEKGVSILSLICPGFCLEVLPMWSCRSGTCDPSSSAVTPCCLRGVSRYRSGCLGLQPLHFST